MRMSRLLGMVGSNEYNWRMDYTEYDYIECTEEPYQNYMVAIQTGVKTMYIKAVFDCWVSDFYSYLMQHTPILVRGAKRSGSGDSIFAYGLQKIGGSNYVDIYPYNTASRPTVPTNQWNSFEMEVKATTAKLKCNGTEILNLSGSMDFIDADYGWTLFGLPTITDVYPTLSNTATFKGKYKRILLYDASTEALVGDLRPVSRNSDGKVGVYDVVNQEFSMPLDRYGEYPGSWFNVGNL